VKKTFKDNFLPFYRTKSRQRKPKRGFDVYGEKEKQRLLTFCKV
jgi:hypothetical protein